MQWRKVKSSKSSKFSYDQLVVGVMIFSLCVFIVLQLLFLTKVKVLIWDEAVYVGIGKYMLTLGKSGLWEILRPPLYPLMLGIVWYIGFNPLIGGQVLGIFFAAGSGFLVYFIGKKVFNHLTGYIAMIFLIFSSIFFLYTTYLLTEIVATCFLLLALYLWISKRPVFLVGLVAAAAFLIKFPNGLVIFWLAIFVAYESYRKRSYVKLIKFGSGVTAIIVPYFLLNYVMYRKYTSTIFDAVLRPFLLAAPHQSSPIGWVSGFSANIAFYGVTALQSNYLLACSVGGIILYFAVRKYSLERNAIGIVGATYFLYFTSIANKQDRFVIFIIPFLAVYAAFFLVWLFMKCLDLRNTQQKKILHDRKTLLFRNASVILGYAGILLLIGLILHWGYTSYRADKSFYNWRSPTTPAIVTEYYTFLTTHNLHGPVMTNDPVPAAYNDNLFIPIYFYLSKNLTVYNEWEKDILPETIIFSPQSYFCFPNDVSCVAMRNSLTRSVKSSHPLLFEKEYQGVIYSILKY
jgi:4-amino-4-deoxy-L-arabinose transferase-like glycosyltransferase